MSNTTTIPTTQLIINPSAIASLIWVGTEPSQQESLLQAMAEIISTLKQQPGYIGAALHKGRLSGGEALQGKWSYQDTGRHVALYTQWSNEADFSKAIHQANVQESFTTAQTLAPALKDIATNPHSTLFKAVIIDRNDGLLGSPISVSGAAPFINFFSVPDGKQQVLVEHFRETIPGVKKETGYLATNAHLSLDGKHFFNYGQYDTVDNFRAIFSEPDVIQAFATFPMQGFVPELHTYEVVLVD